MGVVTFTLSHPRQNRSFLTFTRDIIFQFTIATTCLVDVSEDMFKIMSLEITFEGQFNKVNNVLPSDMSISVSEITSLEILSKSLP